MKKKTKEPLRIIAARIPEQCSCEIVTNLCPICAEWNITFLNGFLIFRIDETPVLVMPLTNIYGTLSTSDTLYILCKNRVLHHFDRETHQHRVTFLDDTDEDIFCQILN